MAGRSSYTSHRHLGEQLYEVPGLFALNGQNFAQDLRISLRGFGSRSAFGIRGIKLVVDGVPETTPDGQGQLDNIAVADISSIQVLQGTSGSRYGNAAGGVLYLSTDAKAYQNLSGSIRLGSYGYQQYRLATKRQVGGYDLSVSGTHLRSDGYRDHSKAIQTNLQFSLAKSTDKSDTKWITSYMDSPQAQDPGGINLDQVNLNRRSARDANVLFDAGEAINHWKSSLQYNRIISETISFNALGYVSGRNFEGRLPFENGGAIDLGRLYGGGTLELNRKMAMRQGYSNTSVGIDVSLQGDDRKRFLNQEGLIGDLTLNQQESFDNLAFYVLHHMSLGLWNLDGSLRYDINSIEISDRFLADGDDSGQSTLNAFNYGIGVSRSISEMSSIYIHHSTSFETPTLSELSANPSNEGGFNQDLDPARAVTYELGWKHDDPRGHRFSAAVYSINTTDELIPFELMEFPGRTFFMNAGKTQRRGIELAGRVPISNGLSTSLSYTYSDFTFGDESVGGANLEGTRLPGLPRHLFDLFADLKYRNWSGRIGWRHVGSVTVTNDGSQSVDPYNLVEFNLGYIISSPQLTITPYLSLHNVLGSSYFDNLRINAFGSRFFEPAATRNIEFGLTVDL